jgi:hypothetical protein
VARKKKLLHLHQLPLLLSQHRLLLLLLHPQLLTLLPLLLTLPLLLLPNNWIACNKKATFGWLFFDLESEILICVNQQFEARKL